MTLATHAVVGALVGQVLATEPALALPAAFLSHFILDAIPHWDYHLASVEGNFNDSRTWQFRYGLDFIIDVMKVGFDMVLGLVAILIIGFVSGVAWSPWAFAAAFCAMIPDFFHFIYSKVPHELIGALQGFHMLVHSKKKLAVGVFVGIGLQVIFLFIVCFSVLYFVV